jgi:predicted metalloprotease
VEIVKGFSIQGFSIPNTKHSMVKEKLDPTRPNFLAGVQAHYAQKKGTFEKATSEAPGKASAVGDDRLQHENRISRDSFIYRTFRT